MTRAIAWSALAATLGLPNAACSGSGDHPPAGTLRGTISYHGGEAGGGRPLSIAVYRSYPPSGPPVVVSLVETFELPYRYELTGLAPGKYWIGALIDVDRMDTRWAGMLNAKRDPHGYAGHGAPVQVTAEAGATGADIELEDPE